METSKNPRSTSMIVAVSVMFLVAIGVTITTAFLVVEKDRGFLFWMTTGFLMLVELIAYSFSLGLLTSKFRKEQVSSPTVVASSLVLVIYGLVGTASIIVYSVIRNADEPSDKVFAAVMMIEAALAFILVLLLRSWDLFFQASQAPVEAKREEHRARGLTLEPILMRLRSFTRTDLAGGIRLDKIAKRLDAVQLALLHSNGGGVGSREAGSASALDPAIESEMGVVLTQLEDAVKDLQGSERGDQHIAAIESLAERLEDFVATLQLD